MSKERDMYVSRCTPYTMTNPKRLQSLWECMESINNEGLKNEVIEAGVYRGGSSMLMAYALKHLEMDNPLILFDTFKGMTKPTVKDVKILKGNTYFDKWEEAQKDGYTDWCYGSFEEVQKNMSKTNYDNVTFVQGDVCETVPYTTKGISKISILRLDTDFYDSTKHLMKHLFPLVEDKGFVIFDDYYCWKGAKDAVDEYFEDNGLDISKLEVVDHSCALYKVEKK